MRSAYITLTLESDKEAERVYAALSDAGQKLTPIQETFLPHGSAKCEIGSGLIG